MRIVFIGCVKSSYLLLKTLLEAGKNIVGVVTKEHSEVNADFVDLTDLCRSYDIDYFYARNINDDEVISFLKDKDPDIIYCFGWSQIIKKPILELPSKGVVGFHPAELPHNRGRHPIIWALVMGLERTASTFFMMDEGADTGDIISQRIIEIKKEDYAEDLYDKIMNAACNQVIDFTEEIESESCILKKQEAEIGNTWRKRTKSDGKIDWRMGSYAIYNLVRGLSRPYVGAHLVYQGCDYKVWRVEEIITEDYRNIEPGKVIQKISDKEIIVKAYDNLIHILECDEIGVKEGEYLE